jgi:hypothetical protein
MHLTNDWLIVVQYEQYSVFLTYDAYVGYVIEICEVHIMYICRIYMIYLCRGSGNYIYIYEEYSETFLNETGNQNL